MQNKNKNKNRNKLAGRWGRSAGWAGRIRLSDIYNNDSEDNDDISNNNKDNINSNNINNNNDYEDVGNNSDNNSSNNIESKDNWNVSNNNNNINDNNNTRTTLLTLFATSRETLIHILLLGFFGNRVKLMQFRSVQKTTMI